MDNLDDKIDSLIRDKLISLIQQNVVRIKRTTIKYTKSNKKHTLEHWQALYDSYDKVFRAMPRELLRVEREVRLKFVSSLTETRVTRLKIMINSEAEILLQKRADECRPEFEKLGHGDLFDQQVQQTREKLNKNLEEQIQKTLDAVNSEAGQGQKLSIQDLIKIYNVKESTLHEINIISPLQSINAQLAKVNGNSRLTDILENFQEGFRYLFQDFQKNRIRDVATMTSRKKLKMEVARDTMTVREVVITTQPFLDQLILPVDKRNPEVIRKSWDKVFELMEGQDERWASVISHFNPLCKFMCGEDD